MSKIKKRHEQILNILSETPLSTISELAKNLAVSSETIRKDLKILSKENEIVQTHGGVALKDNSSKAYSFDSRMTMNRQNKQRLGKIAVDIIEENDVLLMENSTTCLALVEELCKNKELLRTLTIVTNSFKIMNLLIVNLKREDETPKVFFIGGWSSLSQQGTMGYFSLESLKSLHINKTFISGAALNQKLEVTGYEEDSVSFQKEAIKRADETVLMVEKGKYPKSAILNVDSLLNMDYIVTDIIFDDFEREMIRQTSAKLRVDESEIN